MLEWEEPNAQVCHESTKRPHWKELVSVTLETEPTLPAESEASRVTDRNENSTVIKKKSSSVIEMPTGSFQQPDVLATSVCAVCRGRQRWRHSDAERIHRAPVRCVQVSPSAGQPAQMVLVFSDVFPRLQHFWERGGSKVDSSQGREVDRCPRHARESQVSFQLLPCPQFEVVAT